MRPVCVCRGVDSLEWVADYLGRRWDRPDVCFRPVERPVAELRRTAPPFLRKLASRPLRPVQAKLWEVLRNRKRFGTEVVPNVPFWIPELGRGYLLDFLLPEYGFNVQTGRVHDVLVDETVLPLDPELEERTERLARAGIVAAYYCEHCIAERGAESVAQQIRKELGFGRPPWLHRNPAYPRSKVAPP